MIFTKEYKPLFPESFVSLNKSFESFKQSLTAIDHELDNSLVDRGLFPKLTPEGELYRDPELRQKRIDFLGRTREKRVQAFKSGIQRHIDGFDEKQKLNINDRFDFETSRNGFKDYSKEELKGVKKVPKEDKASFDYMAANYFDKYKQPDKSIADEKENMEVWTDRYLNLSHDYSNRVEGHNFDKDDIDLDLD